MTRAAGAVAGVRGQEPDLVRGGGHRKRPSVLNLIIARGGPTGDLRDTGAALVERPKDGQVGVVACEPSPRGSKTPAPPRFSLARPGVGVRGTQQVHSRGMRLLPLVATTKRSFGSRWGELTFRRQEP